MDAVHIEAYLAGELDERGRQQVEHALRNDADLRASFLTQVRMDTALSALLGEVDVMDAESFEQSVMARLRSEGADGSRGFAKSVLTEIVEEREGVVPLRWPDLVKAGFISAAATVALMFVLQGIIFREGGSIITATSPEAVSGPVFVARLEQSTDLRWSPATQSRIREDGWLKNGLLEIESGKARIVFNSGASAMIEGPAELSIESSNRVFLQSGRLTAEVPPPASGFTVNTPRLNAVDIGTRFGVEVLPNGDSELHVMQGSVEASRTSGNSETVLVEEGLALVADSRTRNGLEPVPYAGDNFVMTIGRVPVPVPALRYTFDESVGAMIEDTGSSQVYDVPLVASGELGNAPRRSIGKSGGGLVFQPETSLEVPLSHDFRLDDPFTVSFWVRIPPEIGSEADQVLLRYGHEEEGWSFFCNLSGESGTRGAVRVAVGSGEITGTTDIADGNWHHVAGRFIGGDDAGVSSHFHLFVDGVLESFTGFEPSEVPSARAGILRLGDAGKEGLSGWIDEVNLFREAIPTIAVQDLSGD